MTRRFRIARRLRFLADRIDPSTSPRRMSAVSGFTYEDGLGVVFREDGRGCPLWYMTQDYNRAHDEAGDPQIGRAVWVRTRDLADARAYHSRWLREALAFAHNQQGKPYQWLPSATGPGETT